MANEFIYGIDVSHNNGTVDWEKVQSANPANAFAFIKATEGVGYVDPMCLTNATAVSQKTQMRFGYYHFASLNNNTNVSKDASDEASWFVQTMQTMPAASVIPVLDIESNASKLTPTQVQEWISAFMAQMNTLGFPKVILYSYVSFLNDNLPSGHPFGSLPLWIAHYTSASSPTIPHGWTNYTVWQYSGSGSVNGVSTQCDMNKADSSMLNLAPPASNSGTHAFTRPQLSIPQKPAVPKTKPAGHSTEPVAVTAPEQTQATDSKHHFSKPDSGEKSHSLVQTKKGKNRRFLFFGLKIGKLFFIGLMYGRPDADMKDEEE